MFASKSVPPFELIGEVFRRATKEGSSQNLFFVQKNLMFFKTWCKKDSDIEKLVVYNLLISKEKENSFMNLNPLCNRQV